MRESFESSYESNDWEKLSFLPDNCEFGKKIEAEKKIEVNLETLFKMATERKNLDEHPVYQELLKSIARYIEAGPEWDPLIRAQKRQYIIHLIAQLFSSMFSHNMNEYLQYLLSSDTTSPYISYLEPVAKQVLPTQNPNSSILNESKKTDDERIVISSTFGNITVLPIDWDIIHIG